MTGPQIPPPPPPPALDAKAAKEQMHALRKMQREARKQRTVQTLRGVHPSVWIGAGVGVVALGTVVLGARWWSGQAEFQRDTALALAAARDTTATSQPQQAPVSGMQNPLEGMDLTTQAKWLIGPTADGTGLLPGRSTLVVRQILESADACSLFISLDGNNLPRVSKQPGAGAVPLVDCAKPVTSTPTTPTTARQGE